MPTPVHHHHPRFLEIGNYQLNHNVFAAQLSKATYALGLLEGSQRKLHNPSLLLSPLTAKEAEMSSRIEGTISTVSDVFLYEAGGTPEQSDVGQTQQVLNYRLAMQYAVQQLRDGRPLTPHFAETLHGILMKKVRCKGAPGKFRDDTVWLGKNMKDPIENATYIPPEHHLIADYMGNLFKYIAADGEDVLIKAGIAHYQFEAVHPFEDGNGRIGRLMIPLILYKNATLSQPILYISGYLEKNRDEYIAKLHQVDVTGKYETWLAFFFESISEQLKETQLLIDNIYDLYNDMKIVATKTKSPYFIPFIDALFASPYFTIPSIKEAIGASARNTILSLIESFKKEGIIKELDVKAGRAKLYSFVSLVKLLS